MIILRHITAAEVRHQQKIERKKHQPTERAVDRASNIFHDQFPLCTLALLVIKSYRTKNRKRQNLNEVSIFLSLSCSSSANLIKIVDQKRSLKSKGQKYSKILKTIANFKNCSNSSD